MGAGLGGVLPAYLSSLWAGSLETGSGIMSRRVLLERSHVSSLLHPMDGVCS